MTPITLRYRSSRREVWAFYWWCWKQPRGLWRLHAAIAAFFAAIVVRSMGAGSPLPGLLFLLAVLAGVGLVSVLFPQIMFKPQERVLIIDETGLTTTIGDRSGARAWREIMTVAPLPGMIAIVGKSLNGFVVPRRAFDSDEAMDRFLATVKRLHAGDAGYDVGRSTGGAAMGLDRR